jgi:hypothetical protein
VAAGALGAVEPARSLPPLCLPPYFAPSACGGVPLATAYARQQYGSAYTTSMAAQVAHTGRRELALQRRNKLFIGIRLANAVAMGAILGTVFIQLTPAVFYEFFSVSLFAVTFM